jgi:carboxyl-terminal processing protease
MGKTAGPVLLVACIAVLMVCAPGMSSGAEEGYGGFGIMVAQLYDPGLENQMGDLVVLFVTPKGPAERAGIRRGDLITEIDGKPVSGRPYAELTAQLRGRIGTSAALTIIRPPADKTTGKPFTLKRAKLAPLPQETTRP